MLLLVGGKVDQWRGESPAAVSIDQLDVHFEALSLYGARQAQSRLHRVLVSGHDRLVWDVDDVACLERLGRRSLESEMRSNLDQQVHRVLVCSLTLLLDAAYHTLPWKT